MLDIQGLTVRYGSLPVLEDISFSLEVGEWLMVVGPNGAGKSTLIHALSKGVSYEGHVTYKGRNIKSIRPKALAREFGVLSQNHQTGYSFSVEEIVNLGRYAHQTSRLSLTDEQGAQKVEAALEMTGMLPLRKQSVLTLSGGELQRTFLAQVFAQDPNLIMLDEPTNHLDLQYQKQLFEIMEQWVQQPNKAAISIVHDIGIARMYGTHAMLLHHGKLEAYGSNKDALSPQNLKKVYDMDVHKWMRSMLSQWN